MQRQRKIAGLIFSALTLALTLPSPAQAHRAWILPAATVLSSEEPWVTFDAAISNDIFHADYVAMRLDGLKIHAPDGSEIEPQNVSVGKHRTTFDIELAKRGTYKLATAGQGMLASWVENGKPQRWRGSREDFNSEVPTAADQLKVVETARRIETFVTAGAPTDTVFQPTGKGLEMVPLTHPNDLFSGEPAKFRFLIDGEPAHGVEIEVIPGGMRYRDEQGELTATTASDGEASISWPQPGMYWLSAEYQDDQASTANATRRASYFLTLEVLPQ